MLVQRTVAGLEVSSAIKVDSHAVIESLSWKILSRIYHNLLHYLAVWKCDLFNSDKA